jgi:hypothetical protein
MKNLENPAEKLGVGLPVIQPDLMKTRRLSAMNQPRAIVAGV